MARMARKLTIIEIKYAYGIMPHFIVINYKKYFLLPPCEISITLETETFKKLIYNEKFFRQK